MEGFSEDKEFHEDQEGHDRANNDRSHVLAEQERHLEVLGSLAQVLAAHF